MEEQIKAELAAITSGIRPQKITVSRTFSDAEKGTWTFTLESEIAGLGEEETAIAACVVALRAEEAILRNVVSAGALSTERFNEELATTRQGFSKTVAQLVGKLLSKRNHNG